MTLSVTSHSSKTTASTWSVITQASSNRLITSLLWVDQQCNQFTQMFWTLLTKLTFIWVSQPESMLKVLATIALMWFSSPQSLSREVRRSSAVTLLLEIHRPTRLSSQGALRRQALHSHSWIESMLLSRRALTLSSTSLNSECLTLSKPMA